MLMITSTLLALPEAKAFLRVGALTLNTGENRLSSAVIDSAAGFAYFGSSSVDGVNPGLIVKVRLSDFSRVGALRLSVGLNVVSSAVIDASGGFAYFGTYRNSTDCDYPTTPATIVKVRL